MNRAWIVVFLKEVIENARDRRVMLSALLYGPLVGPVLFAVMLSFVLSQQKQESEKALEMPVVGAEHAPNLIAFLESREVLVKAAPADPEAAVVNQELPFVVRISADYGEQWRAGQPALVELIHDRSRQKSRIPVERARAVLGEYSSQNAALRLTIRGIDPGVARPLNVRSHDMSTEQSRAGLLFAMLPYLLILSAFIGGMYLAIDTTAGERERKSLEPLLLSPADRGQILMGKLLATSAYASASLLISILAFSVSVRMIPTEQLGMDLQLSIAVLLQMLIVTLPVAVLASAAQMLVASFARSFREAQTYVQFLMFVPIVPSLLMVLNPVREELWMMCVPLFSQSVLINMLARGEAVAGLWIVVSVISSAIITALLAAVSWRLFRRESFVLAG